MSARIPIWSRVVFVVLLPIVAYNVWDYVESRRLQSRFSAIEQRGEPLVLQGERPTPEALRAERFYRAAAALAVMPAQSTRSIAETNRLTTAWRASQWTPETLALARADVDANRDALDFVDRAAGLPFSNFVPGVSYNRRTIELTQLGTLLEYRAAVALGDGRPDAALASFYSDARLGRALEASPTFTGVTILPRFSGLSATVSAGGRAPAREPLARALADLDRDDRLRTSLTTGRRLTLSGSSPLAFGGPGPGRHAANPFVAHLSVWQLDAFADLIRAADAPWPQRIEAVDGVDRWPFGFPWRNAFSSQALRAYTKSIVEQVREIRCARLIVSLQPLDLIDPLTGTRLEPSQCRL